MTPPKLVLMPGALSSNEPETLSSREGGLRLLVRGFSFGAAARELSLPPPRRRRAGML